MTRCTTCERNAAKINGTKMKLPKASKVNFVHMGGMLVGYKVAGVATGMVRKKDATTGFLDGTMGGAIKAAVGLGLSAYSKPGSFMQGVGDGVAFNGATTLLNSFGVSMSGLEGARMGMGADVRYNRLTSQIAGNSNVREMGEQRQKVYAKVA
jgi:hypothetical protein